MKDEVDIVLKVTRNEAEEMVAFLGVFGFYNITGNPATDTTITVELPASEGEN